MTQPLGPNQQKLVDTLRDPGVRQGMNFLETIDGCFCVLGFCCVVMESDTVQVRRGKVGERYCGRLFGSDLDDHKGVQKALALYTDSGDPNHLDPCFCESSDKSGLTKHINELVGIKGQPLFSNSTEDFSLMNLNDSFGLTFADFADLLEKFPHLYFKKAA